MGGACASDRDGRSIIASPAAPAAAGEARGLGAQHADPKPHAPAPAASKAAISPSLQPPSGPTSRCTIDPSARVRQQSPGPAE